VERELLLEESAMKTLRTLEDLERAHLPGNVFPVARDLLAQLIADYAEHGHAFNPDEDGHIVLIEEWDADDDIRAALGAGLLDAVLEGCVYERGCFVACVLFNNQFGVSIVVEDAPWLDPAVRERLMQNL
jgi:hypothetical protein